MFAPDLLRKADAVLTASRLKGLWLTTAESCTGGLVAALLTDRAGASNSFSCSFVTYSNDAKSNLLGVDASVFDTSGAVSAACAKAMAVGALERSGADVAVSITGIAGPGGGSSEKPVGLVHFAVAHRGPPVVHVERRFGDRGRGGVRMAAVEQALALFADALHIKL